jgi:hypothetical protein
VSTVKRGLEIDLKQIHADITELARKIKEARSRHNSYLKELGLPEIQ